MTKVGQEDVLFNKKSSRQLWKSTAQLVGPSGDPSERLRQPPGQAGSQLGLGPLQLASQVESWARGLRSVWGVDHV